MASLIYSWRWRVDQWEGGGCWGWCVKRASHFCSFLFRPVMFLWRGSEKTLPLRLAVGKSGLLEAFLSPSSYELLISRDQGQGRHQRSIRTPNPNSEKRHCSAPGEGLWVCGPLEAIEAMLIGAEKWWFWQNAEDWVWTAWRWEPLELWSWQAPTLPWASLLRTQGNIPLWLW